MSAVYFDHNATTPLDPRVRDEMLQWLGARHGNPSSVHSFGRSAREAVEAARQHVAALIGGAPGRVVFTASGTEANNAAIFNYSEPASSRHIVLSAFEHPSVQSAADLLQERGWSVSRVAPDSQGRIEPQTVFDVLREETALVCLMLANNELGTVQPVADVARGCRQSGVPVLCDAVQAAGKLPVDVEDLGVDLLTIGAHKFHGPLGAAALWIRPGLEIGPFLVGGGQERRRRAGTENVAAIVGFGMAARLAREELDERMRRLAGLRDRFEQRVREIANVTINGGTSARLPNTSNLTFVGLSAESLMIRLDLRGFAVSAGAACSSGKIETSATLAAIGLSEEEAASVIRVSFGMGNVADEVDEFIDVLKEELPRLASTAEAAR